MHQILRCSTYSRRHWIGIRFPPLACVGSAPRIETGRNAGRMTPWFNMGFNMVANPRCLYGLYKIPLKESMGLVCLPAATMKKSTINVKVNYTIHGSYGYRIGIYFPKYNFRPQKKWQNVWTLRIRSINPKECIMKRNFPQKLPYNY